MLKLDKFESNNAFVLMYYEQAYMRVHTHTQTHKDMHTHANVHASA